MRALVACALGTAEIDLDDEEVVGITDEPLDLSPAPDLDLPLVVAAAAHGSTVVAVVDRRPPLIVSNDGGATWREAGAGLAPGTSVAISPDHPDVVLFATGERLHVSHDGGRFWHALAIELPGITGVALTD
jgi:hypothetical protein